MHDDPRNPELEAAIAADPDDRALLQVHADWLLERRDPRGELIALQCAGAPQEAIDELLERHGTYLLGPLARYRMQLTWGIGYIRSFDLAACHVKKSAVVPLLQHPSLRFLNELRLVGTRGLEALPASLRALELRGIAGVDLSELAPVVARLTSLTVGGDWSCEGLAFPALETARFEDVGVDTAARLAEASWPRLANLTLHRCRAEFAGTLLAPMSGLRTLRLEHVWSVDDLCAALVAMPFAPRLTAVHIHGELTDLGASAFLDDRLASLASIELMDTDVSDDAIELMRVGGRTVERARWLPRHDGLIMDG